MPGPETLTFSINTLGLHQKLRIFWAIFRKENGLFARDPRSKPYVSNKFGRPKLDLYLRRQLQDFRRLPG